MADQKMIRASYKVLAVKHLESCSEVRLVPQSPIAGSELILAVSREVASGYEPGTWVFVDIAPNEALNAARASGSLPTARVSNVQG